MPPKREEGRGKREEGRKHSGVRGSNKLLSSAAAGYDATPARRGAARRGVKSRNRRSLANVDFGVSQHGALLYRRSLNCGIIFSFTIFF